MTSLDFDASLKHSFIILHVLFLGGAASYIILDQNQIAMFFGISSAISLIYYVMYQEMETKRRIQAHLNLIEEAVEGSEDFRERMSKKDAPKEDEEEPSLEEKLGNKNVEEAKEFIDQHLETYETQAGKEEFLTQVTEAENNGDGNSRVTITNHANEKLIEVLKQ